MCRGGVRSSAASDERQHYAEDGNRPGKTLDSKWANRQQKWHNRKIAVLRCCQAIVAASPKLALNLDDVRRGSFVAWLLDSGFAEEPWLKSRATILPGLLVNDMQLRYLLVFFCVVVGGASDQRLPPGALVNVLIMVHWA